MTDFRTPRRRPPVPRLHCLVDAHDDLALLPALAEAGCDGFQVRAKELATRDLVALARVVLATLDGTGATVLVDDRLDVALAVGADGVHLGAGDLPVADARRLAPDLLVGATCRDRADVDAAAAAGADYAGVGPVFATTSKAGLPDPLGLAALPAVVGPLPVVAIGGMAAPSAAAARAAGAHGVAVIGAVWRHRDPVAAVKELVTAIGA